MLGAYALGSLSFAVIVSRIMGLADPRSYGSHNPGATNVLRSGSRKAAFLTLFLDGAKGYLAPMLYTLLPHTTVLGIAAVSVAVFLGHLYPIFFGFHGGKGVATAAGVILFIDPILGAISILIWISTFALFRYSSLAAVLTALAAPILYCLLPGTLHAEYTIAFIVISALLLWRHRENIKRLVTRQESKFKK